VARSLWVRASCKKREKEITLVKPEMWRGISKQGPGDRSFFGVNCCSSAGVMTTYTSKELPFELYTCPFGN